MTLTEAQDKLFAMAERGEIEYQAPLYHIGPGYFIIDGERIPTNSMRLIPIAEKE